MYKVSCGERDKKYEEKDLYLNCEARAELVADVTIGPARGQELLLDLGEGGVELSSIVHLRTGVLHTLESHSHHCIGV